MFSYSYKTLGKNNKKVIFFLIGWKGKIGQHFPIALFLMLKGYRVIIYEYSNEILSPDVEQTVKNCNKVRDDVLRQIKELETEGVKSFCLFGNSMGTILSLMIANSSPKSISKIILNLVGADLAETVWTWDKVKRLEWFKRDLLKQKIDLEQLKKAWKTLSPINNIQNLHNIPLLIYVSQKDELIPFQQSQKITEELSKVTEAQVIFNNNNHMGGLILNLLRAGTYLKFLKKSST